MNSDKHRYFTFCLPLHGPTRIYTNNIHTTPAQAGVLHLEQIKNRITVREKRKAREENCYI